MADNPKKPEEKNTHLRILAAGDIHGNSDLAKKLAEKAERNNVDLVVLLGDIHGAHKSKNIIAPFKKANKKVIFVPGNWDSSFESLMSENIYDIRNIDGLYTMYNGVAFIGLGNPDFKLSVDERKSFDKLKGNFDKLYSNKSIRKKVLISHLHASGTKTDQLGFPGSSALRKAIDHFQPDFFLHAHIHETEGIEEKIGKTKVINIGSHGRIIDL